MDSDEQGLPAPGAALLLIIGEPFSEDQKSLILEEITKGFRCWDVEDTGIDINQELAQIANRASQGEEGANGERLIQHQSENLAVEILVNPLSQTVKNSIKKLLIASSPTKYVIYAGHAFQGSGAWVLQDDVFAFNNLAQVFKNADVETALKQNIEANLTIHTLADNHWGTSISKAEFTNHLRIQLNPPAKLENIHGVLQFTAYVGIFVSVTPVANLLQTSEQFGNIRFTRPTLYIFPGCQGDSALFGVNGFNLLVNAGYNRKACFWDFARHLDRVDAMLLTHLGTDNIFGINAALQRKSHENIHPQISYLFFNTPPDKVVNPPVNEKGDADSKKPSSLLVNLAEEANNMTRMAKQLGISPQSCLRSATSQTVEPVNLFHMLGHGSLDMYILNPVADSKELKEFFQQWSKQASNLGTSGPYSLQNAMSVCALLVWKPYNPNEKIVRILFPGNAPQHKIAEGFEKMKTFAFLKRASCTAKDLQKPAAVKKTRPGTGTTASKGTTRSTTSRTETSRAMNSTSTRTELSRKPEPRSTATRTEPRTLGTTSPTKTPRTPREDNNKKNGKVGEKTKSEEKDTKARPSSARPASASSPTKASRKPPSPTKATSPVKSPSPPKASSPVKSQSPPKATSPVKSPTKAKSPDKEPESVPNEIQPNLTNVSSGDQSPMVNHTDQQELKPESDQIQASQPDQLETGQTLDKAGSENHSARPEPEGQNYDKIPSILLSSADEIASVDRQKLEDLGVYDDGHKPNESDVHSPFQTNGENDYEDIQPQALPEPAAIMESPCQESDAMLPNYDSKIESDEQELSEFSKVEEELQQLEEQEDQGKMFEDPAEDIPPSPEPAPEEQRDIQTYHSSMEASSVDPPSGFETPVFNNDDLDAETANTQMSLEQKIQYGIDESSRSMAGIQEVDEEEHDEDFNASKEFKDNALSTNALREMGIYDDEEEDDLEEGNEKESGFEKDDVEDEVKQTLNQDQQSSPADYKENIAEKKDDGQEKEAIEVDDEVVSDYRSSAERQFEDVEDDVNQDEGIELNAEEDNARKEEDDDDDSIPAAFDKDSSSEMDMVQTDEQNADLDAQPSMGSNDQGLAEQLPNQEREDTDSIDGGTPDDDDKDIDETFSQRMNGDGNNMAEHFPTSFPDQITVGDAKSNPFVGVDNQGATVNNLSQSQQAHTTYELDSDSELQGKDGQLFDPVAEWGHPMGLPSPPPTARGDAKKSAASPQKSSSTDRRPASAPAKSATSTARSAKPGGFTRPGTATRRPGSSRSSPQSAKVPPLPPMTPFYMDLTYIPNHGDSAYCDVEFFKRIRARYYILSALSPNPQVLDSLMEAKATWEEKDLEVTLIPTYDNETLRHWMGLNKEKLQELHIDMTPAVSRCTIQLQDLETSLPAYRLEV